MYSLTILVNRGWVPPELKDPRTRPEGQIEDEIELEGILRLKEDKPTYSPAEFHNKNRTFRYRLSYSEYNFDIVKISDILNVKFRFDTQGFGCNGRGDR